MCAHDPGLQSDIARWSVLWCYSTVQFCSGAADLDPLARGLLSAGEAVAYDAAPNKFNFCELRLRKLFARVTLSTDQVRGMDAGQRLGRCERHRSSAPGRAAG